MFILIAAGLVIIGADQKDKIMLIMVAMAIPFLFIGIWNIYGMLYEKRTGYTNEYFTYKSTGTIGTGAFYSKKIILPVFLIMFGTNSCAIGSAFLAMNHSEEIAIALVAFSFVYALTLTIIFMLRLSRETPSSLTK